MKTSLTLSLALTAALFSKSSASSCHWGFSSEFFFPAPYIADLCNHFNGVGSSFMFTCANETRFSFYTPSWNDSGIYEYRGIMLGFNSDDCDFDTIYNYTWLNDSEAYCVGYEPPQTTEEILDSSCPVMEIGLEYYSNDGCNGVQYFDGAVYVAHWDFCEELHDDGSYWSVMTSKNNGYELGVYTDSSCAGTEFQNFDVPPGCGGTDGVSNQTYYTFSVYNDSDLYTTTGMGGGDMSTTASGFGPFDCNVVLWNNVFPLVEGECSWEREYNETRSIMSKCNDDGTNGTIWFFDSDDCSGDPYNVTQSDLFYCGNDDNDGCRVLQMSGDEYDGQNCTGNVWAEGRFKITELEFCTFYGFAYMSLEVATSGIAFGFWGTSDCSGTPFFQFELYEGCNANESLYLTFEEETTAAPTTTAGVGSTATTGDSSGSESDSDVGMRMTPATIVTSIVFAVISWSVLGK